MVGHVPITINPAHLQATTPDNPATPYRAAPSFDTYRNKPASYAHAAEQYFAGNIAWFHQYLMKQPREAQKALIEHSEVLRDYLGIGHPKALRKRLPQSSASPLITYTEAPAALSLAATRVTAESRADRALDALADVLAKNPIDSEPDTRDGRDYKKSVERAFVQLLNDFQQLPSDAARRKAIGIIGQHYSLLNSSTKEKILSAVVPLMSDPTIIGELKNGLQALYRQSPVPSLPPDIHLNILDKLKESVVEDARTIDPDITHDQLKRAAARAMANVRLVSRSLWHSVHRAVNADSEVAAQTVANVMSNFSKLDKETYRKSISDLFSQSRHVGIDFAAIPEDKKPIVLEVLSQTVLDGPNRPYSWKYSRSVKLSGTTLTPEVTDALRRMYQNNSDLKIDLDLSGQMISDQAAIRLARMLQQCGEVNLDLHRARMTAQEIATITGALAQSRVSILDMRATNMDPADAQAIGGALHQSRMSVLNLSNNRRIGPQGVTAIAGSLAQSKLTELYLNRTGMDPQSAMAIAAGLRQSDVVNLDLSDNDIGLEGASALADALPRSNVTNLNLNRSRIGAQGVLAIAGALPRSKVTTLNVGGCHIDVQAAMALAAALQQSNVTALDLSGCVMDHQAAAIIAGALPESKVTHLSLSNNVLGPEGALALARALPRSRVTHLDLGRCHLGPNGAAAIASALPQSKVKYLNLASNSIDAVGAGALASALPGSNVEHFDVSDNVIEPSGGRALAGALPRTKIVYVELKGNNLGDEAVKALVGVLPPQQVKLDLSNNNLGSDAAIAVAKMLSRSNIKHLDLSGNRIGRRGAKALADALPQSNVDYLGLRFNDARGRGTRIGDSIAIAFARTLPKTGLTNLDMRDSFVGNRGALSIISTAASSNISTLGLSTNNQLDPAVTAASNNAAATRPFEVV